MFSCYYWAIYSWNLEEMAMAPPPPTVSTWKAALVGVLRVIQYAHNPAHNSGLKRFQ